METEPVYFHHLSLTLTTKQLLAVSTALAALEGVAESSAPVVAPTGNDQAAPPAEPKTTTRARKQASAGDASSASAKETSSDTAEEGEGAAQELTYDGHIKPLILKIAKDVGEDDAKNALAVFKDTNGKPVGGGKALQPKDYGTFHAMGHKLLADRAEAGEGELA